MTTDTNHSAPNGRRDQNTHPENQAALALQEKLDRLLAQAKPSKRDVIQQQFRDVYPTLETHLANKPLKEVLSAFNTLIKAKVCIRTFNEMLFKERARRDEDGNPICCDACGQVRPLRTLAGPGSDSSPGSDTSHHSSIEA